MQQSGIVVSKEGEYCTVEVMRTSACVGCSKQEGCISCKKKITSKAYNKAGAEVGDIVTLESNSSTVLFFALVVFVLPLVLALVGYFAVDAIFDSAKIGIAVCACIFILSYVIIYFTLEKRPEVAKSVVITECKKQSTSKETDNKDKE